MATMSDKFWRKRSTWEPVWLCGIALAEGIIQGKSWFFFMPTTVQNRADLGHGGTWWKNTGLLAFG